MNKPITKREAFEAFVTKREFHDVMAKLFAYLDKKFDAIDKKFDAIGKRFETESAGMKQWFSLELARHTAAVDERHRTELSVFPALPPKRQRRR
jgi:hypothetical protein